MAADTAVQIWGAGHLVGQTAGVSLAGVYMGSYIVAPDGSVTVPYATDASAVVTPAYLTANFGPNSTPVGSDHDVTFLVNDGTQSVNVTVPVLVGLLYTAKGKLLRPVATAAGAHLGKLRRANVYAVLCEDMTEFQGGTSLSALKSATMTSDGGLTPELALNDDQPYTGVFIDYINETPGFDAQFAWQVDQPYRCTIALVSLFHVEADR